MPTLPSSLGLPVSTRTFSLLELVTRAWGSEFYAPDHRIYCFGGVRFFDSTDLYALGIYGDGSGGDQSGPLTVTADNSFVTADSTAFTADS